MTRLYKLDSASPTGLLLKLQRAFAELVTYSISIGEYNPDSIRESSHSALWRGASRCRQRGRRQGQSLSGTYTGGCFTNAGAADSSMNKRIKAESEEIIL